MLRTNWKSISTLLTMVALTGCQDHLSSLTDSPPVAPARISLAPAGRPQLSIAPDAEQNASADFTVTPQGGVFFVGNTAVVFPANAICDPKTSGYGVSKWHDRCVPLSEPITIHATVRATKGQLAVDYSPSLRFAPSTNPAQWVWMFMSVPAAVGTTSFSRFNILYVPTLGGAGYDESLSDPTLRTYVDPISGLIVRRAAHFSGYLVSTGRQ